MGGGFVSTIFWAIVFIAAFLIGASASARQERQRQQEREEDKRHLEEIARWYAKAKDDKDDSTK